MIETISMPTQVFGLASTWLPDLVTVFARDLRDAETVYFEWFDAHHPDRPTEAAMCFPYSSRWLLGRPDLGAACRLNQRGVGYWDMRCSRWLVGEPTGKPLGLLARPERGVKYHRVRASDGDELMVFA
jgi:hypothetical protein